MGIRGGENETGEANGMKNTSIANVRNFVFLGHTGSGKTAMIDRILHKLGVNDRIGSTLDGTSMADFTEEEKERQISVWAKPFIASYKSRTGRETELVMLDTPGYADFIGQMLAATRVADAGLIAVDAAGGIEVGTSRVWKRCEKLGLPRAIVVTGLDKDNTDFDATLETIRQVWGDHCVPLTLPAAGGGGVVTVLGEDDKGAAADRVEEIKGGLIELAAETDDSLIEKYLGGESLTQDELYDGLRGAIRSGGFIPVFAVATPTDVGLDEMLEAVAGLFPSPADRDLRDADGTPLDVSAEAPFAGEVWRTTNDPFVGHMTFVRVWNGTLKADGELFNASRDHGERTGKVYLLNGKKQEAVEEARAGDIVALAKLKDTHMNDSLCAPGSSIRFEPIECPRPVVAYAVYPKSSGDEDKLANGLHRVAEDDPTISVERNAETHELILSGMGDVQLSVAVEHMKKRSNVDVDLTTPKVAYRETINGKAEGHHKHKKQSGGRGQYGEVYLRVEPKASDDEEWFVDEIVGGAIPSGFLPAVQKGLLDGMTKGALAGYPVRGVKVRVYDGSYHDVDSSEVAFKIAGARALRDAMSKAKPVLLEPVMKIRVYIPEQYLGDITGDLNHKRGRILGMGSEDGMQVLEAEVPQAEIFQYSSQLRSVTGGRGSFELEFARYDVVPSNVAQKIIAEAEKEKEED
jgi:elongation factor G